MPQGYVEAGQDAYEQKCRERVVQNLTKRARQMGFELTPCHRHHMNISWIRTAWAGEVS